MNRALVLHRPIQGADMAYRERDAPATADILRPVRPWDAEKQASAAG